MIKGHAIHSLNVASFVLKVSLTPMAKFMTLTLMDGTLVMFETLTRMTWRTEKVDGKHSGVAAMPTNYVLELTREGYEHNIMKFLDKNGERL